MDCGCGAQATPIVLPDAIGLIFGQMSCDLLLVGTPTAEVTPLSDRR